MPDVSKFHSYYEYCCFRSLYCTELECVAAKATLRYLEKEMKELEKIRLIKQAQVDTLYAKYKQIQDFEKVVVCSTKSLFT